MSDKITGRLSLRVEASDELLNAQEHQRIKQNVPADAPMDEDSIRDMYPVLVREFELPSDQQQGFYENLAVLPVSQWKYKLDVEPLSQDTGGLRKGDLMTIFRPQFDMENVRGEIREIIEGHGGEITVSADEIANDPTRPQVEGPTNDSLRAKIGNRIRGFLQRIVGRALYEYQYDLDTAGFALDGRFSSPPEQSAIELRSQRSPEEIDQKVANDMRSPIPDLENYTPELPELWLPSPSLSENGTAMIRFDLPESRLEQQISDLTDHMEAGRDPYFNLVFPLSPETHEQMISAFDSLSKGDVPESGLVSSFEVVGGSPDVSILLSLDEEQIEGTLTEFESVDLNVESGQAVAWQHPLSLEAMLWFATKAPEALEMETAGVVGMEDMSFDDVS